MTAKKSNVVAMPTDDAYSRLETKFQDVSCKLDTLDKRLDNIEGNLVEITSILNRMKVILSFATHRP